MRRFFLKSAIFLLLLAALVLPVLKGASHSFVDLFYTKFTQPARSLVAGSSRAAQGLDPALVGADAGCEGPFLNFAFTNANSPYGPVYFSAIQRKVPRDTRDGLFILEVNPLMISINEKEKEDEAHFRENGLTLDRQLWFNTEPNYAYLLHNYRQPLYRLLLKKDGRNFQTLHGNGFLEQRLAMDSASVAARKKQRLDEYTGVFKRNRESQLRLEWLQRTAAWLREHGRVVLLRMPTSPEMSAMETAYMPEFDARMLKLATAVNANYINLISESSALETTDGNHLSIDSARLFSKMLNARLRSPAPDFTRP